MTTQPTVDPRDKFPKPPYPEQGQPAPGEQERMSPQPDSGENEFRGYGRLKDRVAVVTGADSGIGRAVALAFANEGADVVIAYLNEHDDAQRTRELVEARGRRAVSFAGDLADPAHCRQLVAQAVTHFGRIDILVNNAAFQGRELERLEDLDDARLEQTFRVNVMAMFRLTREALPHMNAGASVINTSSIQAYQPSADILDYAATKAAIVAFTKGLAKSLIERGIRANAVAPGPVWTPLIVQSYEPENAANKGKASPMKRPAQPVEVAPAYVFLASDEGHYVNGEVLGVTGNDMLP
jgi:NAD(P)-dependent dehydrogenase (short-subunit alcohol dehydrogenase family)